MSTAPAPHTESAPGRESRPPRAIAWVVLLASASAVLLVGLLATILVLGSLQGPTVELNPGLWVRFLAASGLTVASLGLRSLRWIFLLRRAGARIPIRDAYVAYLAGLSLLLVPFLIGEIAVRAFIQRARGRVPLATTIIVNLWERFLDLAALVLMVGVLGHVADGVARWSLGALLVGSVTLATPVRRVALGLAAAVSSRAARLFEAPQPWDLQRLLGIQAWLVALGTSVVAWALPGFGFWLLAGAWGGSFDLLQAELAYAVSASLGGLVAAPGGVLVAGGYLLESLNAAGYVPAQTALAVLGVRLATLGVATLLGGVFLLMHLRSLGDADRAHFDAIADSYDVQIPEGRRHALLVRKTDLMRESLQRFGVGRRGLDIGCGQGAHVARMRQLGFDVVGIDSSVGQVTRAARKAGVPGLVAVASALQIPAADRSLDFVYAINVLHHLPSLDEQRRALAELLRVVRPGGLLFVHEINTRNLLFRFYMGYVFPSLNCIDEGVERWLRPHRLAVYTDAPVAELRYFTFLPDFLPQRLVRLLTPLERVLEASPLRVYSAHYMAVVRK